MKPVRTCILVADGAHARVYLNQGPGHGLKEIQEFADSRDIRESRDIASDQLGRSFDSGGEGRHAMEPPTDPKRHEIKEFHREVADGIVSAFKANRFDRLVLVAPPRTLGNLRNEIESEPSLKIHAEINKDLVKSPRDDLLKYLGEVIAI